MKVLIQRVGRAEVRVAGSPIARIGRGLLVFVAVEKGDEAADAEYYADRTAGLRIFEDHEGRMNLSLKDIGAEALVVSQFTLAGSTRRGRRPSFDGAEEPERADVVYQMFVSALARSGIPVRTGRFREMMEVELVNEGPVTFLLDPRTEPRHRRREPD